MEPVIAERRTLEDETVLDAAPRDVFPLLCPVREYDWIETWSCEVVHAASGLVEDGCVFRTASPAGEGHMTWIVTRREPDSRLEFACFVPDLLTMRLRIGLEPARSGCRVRWHREFTALSPAGAAFVRGIDEAAQHANTALLFRRLAHYLRAGEMLRAS